MTTATPSAVIRPAGIFMPTRDQLIAAYRGIVAGAEKNGALEPLRHAPLNAEKFPRYDIQDLRRLGVSRQVYAIQGELFLKTSVVYPGASARWFKVGPAPLF